MKRKVLVVLVTSVLLLSFVLTGCQSGGGIAQEVYDQVTAQLKEAQDKIAELQSKEVIDIEEVKSDVEAKLKSFLLEWSSILRVSSRFVLPESL